MKLIKAAWPLTFVLALAACGDDAEKFEGVWANEMGFMLMVNEGATEATVCAPDFGGAIETMKVAVEDNLMKSADNPALSGIEWREVDGKPHLVVEGELLEKVEQSEWDKSCK